MMAPIVLDPSGCSRSGIAWQMTEINIKATVLHTHMTVRHTTCASMYKFYSCVMRRHLPIMHVPIFTNFTQLWPNGLRIVRLCVPADMSVQLLQTGAYTCRLPAAHEHSANVTANLNELDMNMQARLAATCKRRFMPMISAWPGTRIHMGLICPCTRGDPSRM